MIDYSQVDKMNRPYVNLSSENTIQKMLDALYKLSKTVDISKTSDLLWSAYGWHKLAGDIWIHRQDGVQGHFVLNNAITPLLSALFTVNNEYTPHEWMYEIVNEARKENEPHEDARIVRY